MITALNRLSLDMQSSPGKAQIEMMVTGPDDNRVGKDALTHRSYNSLEGARYSDEGQEDLDDNISTPSGRQVGIRSPDEGVYRIKISSAAANVPATFFAICDE